jgi:hypothetical protein
MSLSVSVYLTVPCKELHHHQVIFVKAKSESVGISMKLLTPAEYSILRFTNHGNSETFKANISS